MSDVGFRLNYAHMRIHKRAFSLNGKWLLLNDRFIYTHFFYRFDVPNARSRVLPFLSQTRPIKLR